MSAHISTCSYNVSGVLVAKLCLTLESLLGSSDHGILQERILDWVAISISRESS